VLAAPPFQEGPLLELAARLQAMAGGALGATRHPLPPDAALIAPSFESQAAPLFVSGQVLVAVSGPQMSGLPQNASLVRLGARQLRTLRSAPNYKLYRLSGPAPARCALVKVDPRRGGASIEVELWEMPLKTFGVWVAGIPAPYAIGTIVLDDGSTAHGVLCESHALLDARDISSHGGWRAYIESQVDVRLEATA
jgi:allophanate hydrolase